MSTTKETKGSGKTDLPLTKGATSRICKDIRRAKKHEKELAKVGIHFHFDDDDITTYYVLIIGAKDTPYEGGFYFFEAKHPYNYPMAPPKIRFLSTASKVRIHPNLYTEGKVCLSVINTWYGDGWSSSLNIRSMWEAIQSFVFVKESLRNEPGYEKGNEHEVKLFSDYVNYQNVRVCINTILQSLPSSNLKPFTSIIESHIRTNAQKYFNRIQALRSEFNKKHISCVAYVDSSTCICDYDLQYATFVKYCANLGLFPAEDTSTISDKKAKAFSAESAAESTAESAAESTTESAKKSKTTKTLKMAKVKKI